MKNWIIELNPTMWFIIILNFILAMYIHNVYFIKIGISTKEVSGVPVTDGPGGVVKIFRTCLGYNNPFFVQGYGPALSVWVLFLACLSLFRTMIRSELSLIGNV